MQIMYGQVVRYVKNARMGSIFFPECRHPKNGRLFMDCECIPDEERIAIAYAIAKKKGYVQELMDVIYKPRKKAEPLPIRVAAFSRALLVNLDDFATLDIVPITLTPPQRKRKIDLDQPKKTVDLNHADRQPTRSVAIRRYLKRQRQGLT